MALRRTPAFACLLLAAIATTAPAAVPASASSPACAGTVYVDLDRDGRRDAGEPGVAGAKVSDGRALVVTGAEGGYRIDTEGGRPVFVVKPPGFDVPTRADGLPAFWAEVAEGEGACPEFALRRAEPSPQRRERLRVLLFADPQVGTAGQVGHFEHDVVETAMREGAIAMPHGFGLFHFRGGAADLGLTLGDVVDDTPGLYPAVTAATTRMGVPWLHLPGNHDIDLDARSDEDSLASYRRQFGPDTHAWEEPEAAFVLLDDVIHLPGDAPGDRPSYTGGLRSDQFDFLEAWLATLPPERTVVVALHIPLFEADGRDTFRDADRARLFELLAPFDDVLVVSGHGHVLRHVFHGRETGWHGAQPLHEFNVGAASGAFWSGRLTDQGVPDATMADGTPNGHAVLEFRADGARSMAWVPAGVRDGERDAGGIAGGIADSSATRFMHLHAPKVLRQGAYPAFGVFANVYMGLPDTRVEFRVDGGAWQPMRRVARADPRLVVENVLDDTAGGLRGYDRSPEAAPSTHLWRGALPTDLAPGAHAVEVRAFDRWHGEQRASTSYRLEAAATP